MEDTFYNEDNMDQNHKNEPVLNFEPAVDLEERQMVVMEKLVSTSFQF